MGVTVSGFDSSSISTLFSSLPGASANSNILAGTTSMLSDYYSIRNGSYHKLLKAYYNSDASTNVGTKADVQDKKEDTYESKAAELKALKEDATGLSDAANKLLAKGSDSVFKKQSVTDKSGKVSYDYDLNAIYEGVNGFVKEYNDMITSGSDSDITSVANGVNRMMQNTKANAALLGKIGISVDGEGKLSLDESTFKNSDMTIAKSLFQSQGGYGYQVATQASMINSAVVAQASGGSYTRTGAVSMNTLMNSYNSYI
ncbi:MAG: hypothetical protein PUB19_03875 [Lachnospiraceae bacterium]|nr:hypothetical protein [Lachnospiraceae bacterium]